MNITSSTGRVALRYDVIRNTTSPEERANNARSYFANVPIAELLKLDTAANLRDYIPDHPGKHRTQAHKAIDVFYVTAGGKKLDSHRQATLETALQRAVEPA